MSIEKRNVFNKSEVLTLKRLEVIDILHNLHEVISDATEIVQQGLDKLLLDRGVAHVGDDVSSAHVSGLR